jgi:hypothetical protein
MMGACIISKLITVKNGALPLHSVIANSHYNKRGQRKRVTLQSLTLLRTMLWISDSKLVPAERWIDDSEMI